MSAALKYVPHYTVADYRQWKGDWELWSGIAIAMTPSPFGRHQAACSKLVRMLGNALDEVGCDATALCDLDWIVRDDTVVRPDVIVICGDLPEEHLTSAPALVAEVLSPSTRTNDLTFKRDLYAREGVGHYLIIDPDANSAEHLMLGTAGDYSAVEGEGKGRFTICGDCLIQLDLTAICVK